MPTNEPFLTDEDHQLRARVREYAQKHVAPHVPIMRRSAGPEVSLAHEIARQGWFGITIASRYQGMGVGHLAKTVAISELSRVSPAMGAMLQASQLGASMIIDHGSEEQKQKWLPDIATGLAVPTIAVTEPTSGSHIQGLHTSARRDDHDYILNGHKTFVGNAFIATHHVVVARTGEGAQGLSAFVVEANRAGVVQPPHRPLAGLRGFSLDDVVLDNVRVPTSNRLGEEGDGIVIANTASLGNGRLNLGAVAFGIHQAIMDETVRFVRTHQRYGGRLVDRLDTVRHNVGRIREGLVSSGMLLYTAAHLLDHGQATDEQLMAAKYRAVEAAIVAGRIATEIQAGHGLLVTSPLPELVQDAACTWPPAGTGDVHRYLFAQKALGIHECDNWSQHTHTPLAGPSANGALLTN